MKIGAAIILALAVAEAQTQEVDPNAFTVVSRDQIPGEYLTVGMDINVRGENGVERTARIREIREETVLLDLNNRLAGKTLIYEVKVLGVESPGK